MGLAHSLGLAVAVVNGAGRIHTLSASARTLLNARPSLQMARNSIALPSRPRQRKLLLALSRALTQGRHGAVRVNDKDHPDLLMIHVAPWVCPDHCLLRFHALHPHPRDLSFLADALELTPRQVEMLTHFTSGMPLARIAQEVGLRPQTVRESFARIYARMQLSNQLELMAALTTLSTGVSTATDARQMPVSQLTNTPQPEAYCSEF